MGLATCYHLRLLASGGHPEAARPVFQARHPRAEPRIQLESGLQAHQEPEGSHKTESWQQIPVVHTEAEQSLGQPSTDSEAPRFIKKPEPVLVAAVDQRIQERHEQYLGAFAGKACCT
jgi:hypothetical protein